MVKNDRTKQANFHHHHIIWICYGAPHPQLRGALAAERMNNGKCTL